MDREMEVGKKQICLGLLAHVDAGKTTLSEGMLYTSGKLRSLGRVDHQDAYLDTYEMERSRGITIFSKQAILDWKDLRLTLLDTPGHVDFSAEMERSLQVMDYAVLVVSGADGVQGHTRTLWRLLDRYGIPVFLFINKMDQAGTDKQALLLELQGHLDGACLDFSNPGEDAFYDALAMCEEGAMEEFLDTGKVEPAHIRQLIKDRKVFPCYFGSALKLWGLEELLNGIADYSQQPQYGKDFGAKVFKISRDGQGNRLTYLKVTGGSLPVRTSIKGFLGQEEWEEKVTQIRLYSGASYETCKEAPAGTLCALTGLTKTRPGQGLGMEADSPMPVLEPVFTYRIVLPQGVTAAAMLPKLKELEEEEPELHIVWREDLQELQAQFMGEVQLEILTGLVKERFDLDISFDTGNIVYKETIANSVEGVGHFEPLRHYAEVHLLLEPLERGSGLQFASACSQDLLDRSWQRLILTHLEERDHKGVLTGSSITDMKLTLIAGRAHLKHTEGGDFRQATYRAVRQGLMQAEPVLLEPYYSFRLDLPESQVGRAMTDLEAMYGKLEPLEREGDRVVLKGKAPVATLQGYQKQVHAYTKGHGHLQCLFCGYDDCHNSKEVAEQRGYDPDRDLDNPSSSVFCAHGAGFLVDWFDVADHMHVPSPLKLQKSEEELLEEEARRLQKHRSSATETWLGTDEVDAIIERNTSANKKDKSRPGKRGTGGRVRRTYDQPSQPSSPVSAAKEKLKEYFLVDGYNVIFAWKELSQLARDNIDSARGRLLDIMCDYQGLKNVELIVVFDAYRVEGHQTEYYDYHNIHVVYTREAETADQYIERFAHEHGKKYRVTVATSDGLEQIIIRGAGCQLVSARDLEKEVLQEKEKIRTEYLDRQPKGRNLPFEAALQKKGSLDLKSSE